MIECNMKYFSPLKKHSPLKVKHFVTYDMTKIVAVASTNPVKVSAVIRAVNSYHKPDLNLDIIAINVQSGVSKMPMTKDETRIGARNRAINVLRESNGWIGVGNEGGVCKIENDWYLFSTTYAWDGIKGRWGAETLIYLPPHLVEGLKGGIVELGDVIDQITGDDNTKQKKGAVGYLTDDAVKREDIFYFATVTALSDWFVDH